MLTLKEIAEAKMALAEGILVPSVWTAQAFDAAEAWAKLVAIPDGAALVPQVGGGWFAYSFGFESDMREKKTPEAAVTALYEKIGGDDARTEP